MAESTAPDPEFEGLLEFLRDERAFDFTGYKRTTLTRRIVKRMQDVGVGDFAAYRKHLESNEGEFASLFDTILINVTEFFRDPTAWERIEGQIIPAIVEFKDEIDPIRVWCAGAASGEEPYTVAMLLAEALGDRQYRERVKIYATDVDEDALQEGRHAVYTTRSVSSVRPEFQDKYFEKQNHGYVVRPELRRSVIFGRHDVVHDPPISRIDLLLCRNTLMYFNSDTQKKILNNFHYALNTGGFLFLGKSEALVTRTDLFEVVDLKRRIFRRHVAKGDKVPPAPGRIKMDPTLGDVMELQEVGLDSVPLAYLVVDMNGRLTFASNQARSLFGLGVKDLGRLFRDLDVSYRPAELRSRLDEAYKEGRVVSITDVVWASPAGERFLDIFVHPLRTHTGDFVGASISFIDNTQARVLKKDHDESKHELETAYEELQSTVEELETTNEELQSTNEELETTNEELQSTNEELETMNEELQSTNEELEAINTQVAQKSLQLDETNEFLESILGGVQMGVAVIDQNFAVVSWSKRAEDLWGTRRDEAVGLNFLNLDIGLPTQELRPALRSAISGESDYQQVVVDATNRKGKPIQCTIAISPLRSNGEISGAIVMMEEVARP